MKMNVFFIVLSRDGFSAKKKARELSNLGYPYVIICGEKVDHPKVAYREPRGKYDAINYGAKFVPSETDVIALNDVDTEIHNFETALNFFNKNSISLMFVKVEVNHGPQVLFYSLLNALRKRVPIAASGELMLIKREVFEDILPLKGCRSEDTYILFKVLEHRYNVAFCEDCYVTTRRTVYAKQESEYKRRTVGGIYQALSMTKPPILVRLFYTLLPFVSPLLLVTGSKGYYWTKGILLGFVDYIEGDRSATWQPTYAQGK